MEPLRPHHAAALHSAFDGADSMWNYMPAGPFTAETYAHWVDLAAGSHDPMHFVVLVDEIPLGTLSLLRIDTANGVAEVGWIAYSPRLQKTRAATEAVVLLARTVFGMGYRRFEWKCDAANLPSRRAAERFGFSYEGIFRQAVVVKGRNRDTAWFAMIDAEFEMLNECWTTWLDVENFDAEGRQKAALSASTRHLLAARDPGL